MTLPSGLSLVLCTLLLGTITTLHAAILDLSVPNGADDAPTVTTGTVNGAIFNFGQTRSGSGNFDPFVRLQANNLQGGYNTDHSKPGFDEKTGTWTHSVLVGDLPTAELNGNLYFEFLLDLNAVQNNNGRRVSLDDIKIYQGDSGNMNTIDLSTLGTLVFDLDAGDPGNTVLLNTFSSGSGVADYSVLIPVWDGADVSKFMSFYSHFGAHNGGGGPWTTDDGFEEWAFDTGRSTYSEVVPEPSLAFLGLVAGGCLILRRRQ